MSRKRVIKEEIQEERYLARGLAQDHKLLTGKCAVLSSMSSTIKKKKRRERKNFECCEPNENGISPYLNLQFAKNNSSAST